MPTVTLTCRTVSAVVLMIGLVPGSSWATEGFYRDIFIDGGCHLTARESLAAAEYLGLTQEALWTPYDPVTDEHRAIQAAKIVGDENDSNGCLLYPDGAPRFRMIQTNGGSATRHGRSLEEEGRQRVRDGREPEKGQTGVVAPDGLGGHFHGLVLIVHWFDVEQIGAGRVHPPWDRLRQRPVDEMIEASCFEIAA